MSSKSGADGSRSRRAEHTRWNPFKAARAARLRRIVDPLSSEPLKYHHHHRSTLRCLRLPNTPNWRPVGCRPPPGCNFCQEPISRVSHRCRSSGRSADWLGFFAGAQCEFPANVYIPRSHPYSSPIHSLSLSLSRLMKVDFGKKQPSFGSFSFSQ